MSRWWRRGYMAMLWTWRLWSAVALLGILLFPRVLDYVYLFEIAPLFARSEISESRTVPPKSHSVVMIPSAREVTEHRIIDVNGSPVPAFQLVRERLHSKPAFLLHTQEKSPVSLYVITVEERDGRWERHILRVELRNLPHVHSVSGGVMASAGDR